MVLTSSIRAPKPEPSGGDLVVQGPEGEIVHHVGMAADAAVAPHAIDPDRARPQVVAIRVGGEQNRGAHAIHAPPAPAAPGAVKARHLAEGGYPGLHEIGPPAYSEMEVVMQGRVPGAEGRQHRLADLP